MKIDTLLNAPNIMELRKTKLRNCSERAKLEIKELQKYLVRTN
jgi:hypothetical protein